tara:strand:- start:1110 stop:2036 length:927 start_codon:yes stop_codon:yes gene_type:complete
MFDVIIPTYNSNPEFLRVAVESVLQQTYFNFQIYICDGTPSDSPYQVKETLKDYDDDRIHILKQTGVGPSNARNEAFQQGDNPYVALLDADDWWEVSKLEYIENFLQLYQAKMIWSAMKLRHYNNADYRTGFFENWKITSDEHRWFRVYWKPLATSSIVFERKMLEKFDGWDEKLFMGEDTELNVRVLQAYPSKCFQINAYMGGYRKHEGQSTVNESHYYENIKYGLHPNHRPELFQTTLEKLKDSTTNSYTDSYWNQLENAVQDYRISSDNPKENDWENYVLLRVDGTPNGTKFKEHTPLLRVLMEG